MIKDNIGDIAIGDSVYVHYEGGKGWMKVDGIGINDTVFVKGLIGDNVRDVKNYPIKMNCIVDFHKMAEPSVTIKHFLNISYD